MTEIVNRIVNRVKSVIGKALIEAVTDSGEIQLVKISGLADEVQSDMERVQDYGLSSNPPSGSEAVVLYVGGNKDHGIVIKTDSGEFRVKELKSGEVCMYSKFGQTILLDENGKTIFNSGTDVAVKANALSTWLTTSLSVSTAFGPSGPAITGLTASEKNEDINL